MCHVTTNLRVKNHLMCQVMGGNLSVKSVHCMGVTLFDVGKEMIWMCVVPLGH